MNLSPPFAEPVLLQARPLILTGLPYKREEGVTEVRREARTGATSRLRVTYVALDPRHALPFGADRSLLAWITTRAFRDGWLRFSAVADYFDTFGLAAGGRGHRIFWQRFLRLANLALRVEYLERDEAGSVEWLPLTTAPVLPGDPQSLAASVLRRPEAPFERYAFRLDRRFWHHLRRHGVPTPVALLRPFHNAPRSWDFAQLVLYRSFVARQPTQLPFPELSRQMGIRDRDSYRLKHRLNRVLDTIRRSYPDCPAQFLPGLEGLQLQPWRPYGLQAPDDPSH